MNREKARKSIAAHSFLRNNKDILTNLKVYGNSCKSDKRPLQGGGAFWVSD
jgi:hypothetical protein